MNKKTTATKVQLNQRYKLVIISPDGDEISDDELQLNSDDLELQDDDQIEIKHRIISTKK